MLEGSAEVGGVCKSTQEWRIKVQAREPEVQPLIIHKEAPCKVIEIVQRVNENSGQPIVFSKRKVSFAPDLVSDIFEWTPT